MGKGLLISGGEDLTAWGCELEGAEANVVKSFIIKNHALVCILNELVDRQGCIVRLNDGIGDLRGREDGESEHHSIWVFLPDLRNQKGPHSRSSPSTQRMTHLKSCRIQKHNAS
jgi:hypothetical protein